MIIYTNSRSKRKKRKTKKELAEYDAWLKRIQADKTEFSTHKTVLKPPRRNAPEIPADRNMRVYPSVQDTHYDTFRKPDKFYTGDAMIGIGTLHKSNAVPLFNTQDAKDQANMRR